MRTPGGYFAIGRQKFWSMYTLEAMPWKLAMLNSHICGEDF